MATHLLFFLSSLRVCANEIRFPKEEAREVRDSFISILIRSSNAWRSVPYLIESGIITKEEARKVKEELISLAEIRTCFSGLFKQE